MIHSYPEVFALGHKAIEGIFEDDVLVEEKVDGSQLSFGLIEGALTCKSKGKIQMIDAPDDMFKQAVEVIKTLPLHPEWTYRGEYLQKPKHNALVYSRTPKNNIILFDVNTGLEAYMPRDEKEKEAERLGLEIVPVMYYGKMTDFTMLQGYLDKESVLGGVKVEGVVIKNYARFGKDKKALMGKYVSEQFKETNKAEWRVGVDFLETLILEYKTDARWQKGLQHLKEQGLLQNAPQDIGLLMKEIPADIIKECGEEIKEKLYAHYIGTIKRGVVRGLPEWYKELLAKSAFVIAQ